MRAINFVDEGPVGMTVTALTLPKMAPEQPAAPYLDFVGNNLRIWWSRPWQNDDPIFDYKVVLKNKAGFWVEYDQCNAVSIAQECSFDFMTFKTAMGLLGGDSIYAQVKAINSIGESALSVSSQGLLIPDSEQVVSAFAFNDVSASGFTLSFTPGQQAID